MHYFLTLPFLLGVVAASPLTHVQRQANVASGARDGLNPQAGAIVVDATGLKSTFTTVQAGVNALSNTSTETQYLYIYPGKYVEQVYIPRLKSNLEVQGYTPDASSYAGNTATISYNLARINTTSNDLTATLRVWNANTKFYNLNVENTFGHINSNGQNLAVSAQTNGQAFYGCQLWGYQDTLLARAGNQLYAKTLIAGAIDFIYGMNATAWFEKVDLRTIADGPITANGRTSEDNPSWYVFNNCTVAGVDSTIAAGKNELGRPWREFARVVFQNTEMSDVVPAAGWRVWSNTEPLTSNVLFGEFANTGPGSVGPRVSFATALTKAMVPEDVLGAGYMSEWWYDASYM